MQHARIAPVALATLLASCTAPPPTAPEVSEVGVTTLAAQDAYPLIVSALDEGQTVSQTFRITRGNDEGAAGVRTVEPAASGSALVSWTVEGEEQPRNFNEVVREPSGAELRVVRMPNREREVVTRFEPYFLHFPAELSRDEPVSHQTRMLVADFDAPDTVTREGDSTNTISLLGSTEVLVDGARVSASVVRSELVSTFGPANVTRTTDRWFIIGEGFVGERYTETVRIFGLQSERREREIWLDGVEPMPASEGEPDDQSS